MNQAVDQLRVAACAAALCMAAALPVRALAAQTWELYTPSPTAITPVKEMQLAANEIEKQTNGELKIRIHLGGSLQIQANDIVQAVSDGIVQLGDDQNFSGSIPVGGILRLPALIPTRDQYDQAAKVVLPYVEKAYVKYDVTVLGAYSYPPLELYSRKKLTSLADMKGQKIRTISSEASEWVRRFGGIPITISFPETGPALDRGTVDGVTTTASGAGYVLRDLLKYNYRINIAYSNVYIIVNNAALAKLTPKAQEIVKKEFAAVAARSTKKLFDENEDLNAKMQQGGITVTAASQADTDASEKEMKGFYDPWAKERGPVVIEAMQKVKAAIGGK
jgi:TRAP-type C4-dicarboxylate transport system substrate-binding protein